MSQKDKEKRPLLYTRRDFLWTRDVLTNEYIRLQVVRSFVERGVVWIVLEQTTTSLILRAEGATSRVKPQ